VNRIVAGFFAGFVVGALAAWLVFGRGDGNAELRQARDEALRRDSLSVQRIAEVEAERDSVVARAATATALFHQAKASLDSVLGLPPRVRTVVDTVDGVPVATEWVRRLDFDTLRRSCSAFRDTCADKQRADSLVIVEERRVGLEWRIRGDSLALALEQLPIPREPSRFGFGCAAGYAALVSAGEVRAGPGALCGVTFNFR
jgi:hypothetical protein